MDIKIPRIKKYLGAEKKQKEKGNLENQKP